jgi:hypothetical protein
LANFEIHLVKLGAVKPNESAVATRLKQLFDKVITDGHVRGYQEAHIQWRQDCPASLPPDQLLVYMVQDASDSVVHTYFRPRDFTEGGGFTAWNHSVTSSEVYVSGCDGDGVGVANMIFHEAMHNKGQWPDRQLHGDFGGHGLASASVSRNTDLTSTNIQRMAGVLAARRPQWLGGCDYFNDPLRQAHVENLLLQNRPGGYSVADASAAVRGRSYRPGPCGFA